MPKSFDLLGNYADNSGMNTESITRLFELYSAQSGWTLSTLSTYAAGAGDFYGRLKRGHDVTTRRAARVAQWLSDYWPSDLEWPSDIPRPAPSSSKDNVRVEGLVDRGLDTRREAEGFDLADPGEISRGMTGGNGDRAGDSRANHSRKSDDVRTAIRSREGCRARRMGTGAGT